MASVLVLTDVVIGARPIFSSRPVSGPRVDVHTFRDIVPCEPLNMVVLLAFE